MTSPQDQAATESGDALPINTVLELVFSPSGAIIVVAAVVLIIVLVIAFYRPIRDRIFTAKWRAKWGDREIEHAPPDVTPKIQDDIRTAAAAKAVPEGDGGKGEFTGDAQAVEEKSDGPDQPVSAQRLKTEMWIKAHERDANGLDDAYCQYKDHADRDMSEEELESVYAFLQIRVGRADSFEKLHELETSNKEWIAPSRYLCDYYRSLKSFDKALEHVTVGKSRAGDEESIIGLELRRAGIFIQQDRGGEILGDLYSLIENTESGKGKAQIYEKLADVYEELGDSVRKCRALERALLASPVNKDVRFRLAYEYGESDETIADSIYHYQVLARQDREYSSVLNNLALGFDKLGLKGEALRLWKIAAKSDWPYPSGNRAIELAKAGFYDEAEKIIEEIPEPYRTKSRAIEASNYIKQERSKVKERIEDLNKHIRMRRRYSNEELIANVKAELRQTKRESLTGEWKGSDSESMIINDINERGHVSGEFRTHNKVYRVTGVRTDVLLVLSAKETKRKVMPGLLGFAAPLGASEGTWMDVSYSPDEFDMRLILKNKTTFAGLRIKKETPITEKSAQEIKFVR